MQIIALFLRNLKIFKKELDKPRKKVYRIDTKINFGGIYENFCQKKDV